MTAQGWERVAPQKARHSDGYEVFSDGRFQEGYRETRGKAVVSVERTLGVTYVDPDVFWEHATGELVPVDEADRPVLLERIRDGMSAMGTTTEVARG